MLDAEMREGIRRAAERASSTLTDKKKDAVAQAAWALVDTLKDIGCSDEHAAEVGYLIAAVLATMGSVPLVYLNEMREDSMDAYVFAAGKLAGVYELPERKPEEPEPKGPAPELAAEWDALAKEVAPGSTGTGQYL